MDENKRAFKRRPIELGVRFISREDLETTGTVIDISEGGLAMHTDAAASIGDTIIAYPEGLGRLTGAVVRKFDGGIAIQFELSETQRVYLTKRIDSAVKGVPYIRLLERRAHKRLALNLESEARLIASGETFKCEVVDISESGASINAAERPPIGEAIQIGTLKGLICRHTDEGFAIDFAPVGDVQKKSA
ncbi:MAG: PilZ domain-containing protein [Parvularculaceae bacterium]